MKAMRDLLSQDMSSFQQRISKINVNTPLNMEIATFKSPAPKSADSPKRNRVIRSEKVSMNYSPNKESIVTSESNFNSSQNDPNLFNSLNQFVTHSEFIMPDGTSFE